jgi:hypothetical protein
VANLVDFLNTFLGVLFDVTIIGFGFLAGDLGLCSVAVNPKFHH